LYILGFLTPIVVIVVLAIFFWWYEESTCFDGKQNGDEIGVDCGGSCQLLCGGQALDPVILWSRAFETYEGVYNLVAYVENPNVASEVVYAPYTFKVFGVNNDVIAERRGVTGIPQRESFVVFEGTVRTETPPSRVSFEFTDDLEWEKGDMRVEDIEVMGTILTGTDSMPRIKAILKNNTLDYLKEVEVSVVVFDNNNNAIQSSRTLVDDFNPGEQRDIVFTWPSAFDAGTEVCIAPVDVMLVIDRSGSMNDDGLNPPEPLTAVKEAARTFVSRITGSDRLGVVSFATEATLESSLVSGVLATQEAIKNIVIGQNENIQHTNIFEGLQVAFNELVSNDTRDDVIIMLTDGIASRPIDESDPDFAVNQAKIKANEIKGQGVVLYTIGLGESVDADFLKELASGEEYYYGTVESEDLSAIYEQIATAICKKGPNIIQVIPRVRND